MDWEEYFPDGKSMVAGAQARLKADEGRIRYVNGKYKCLDSNESGWLYNITFSVQDDELVIVEQEQNNVVRLPLAQVEYLKLRPYYFAACIGFKAFIFYSSEQMGEES